MEEVWLMDVSRLQLTRGQEPYVFSYMMTEHFDTQDNYQREGLASEVYELVVRFRELAVGANLQRREIREISRRLRSKF